jgi:hypothetical protein
VSLILTGDTDDIVVAANKTDMVNAASADSTVVTVGVAGAEKTGAVKNTFSSLISNYPLITILLLQFVSIFFIVFIVFIVFIALVPIVFVVFFEKQSMPD